MEALFILRSKAEGNKITGFATRVGLIVAEITHLHDGS
jgi:hypothetical protein